VVNIVEKYFCNNDCFLARVLHYIMGKYHVVAGGR